MVESAFGALFRYVLFRKENFLIKSCDMRFQPCKG